MRVTEKDLIGKLEGFPLEVVQKMLERQVEQGNEADVGIFKGRVDSPKGRRGFDWGKTVEGFGFWYEVIFEQNFNFFFEKYPKDDLKDYSNLVAKDLPTKVTLQDFIKEETNIVKDSLSNTFSTNIGEITLNSEIWHEYYGRGEVLKITKKEVEINFECKFNSCIFALTFTTDTDPKVYAKNNNRHISELKIIK